MKNKIFVFITFSRLWKNEFRDLVNLVIEYLTQCNPVTLNLKFVYDKLVEAQAALQQLHVPYGADDNTEELKQKKDKRTQAIRAILAQVRGMKQSNEVVPIPQLNVVVSFTKRFLKPIVKTNSSTQTDVLKEMFQAIDSDSSVQDAIAALNLQSLFDELSFLQKGFTQTVMQRSNVRAEREEVNTSDVRSNAELALTDLLNEIYLMQKKHSELDYKPLINNLNDTFTMYMVIVKKRSTASQKQIDAKRKVSTINTTTTAENGNSSAVAN